MTDRSTATTTRDPETTQPGQYAWSRSDTSLALRLALGWGLAWSTGERSWERIALAQARRHRKRGRSGSASLGPRLAAVLGRDPDDGDFQQLIEACLATATIRRLQFLRCHRPGGWQPPIELRGREHFEAALSRGHGVILWVAPTAYASLLTKLTFHRSGIPLCHLSRWYHGSSRTRWGTRLLNPVQRWAEDEFLAERIVIGPGQSPLPATRRLRHRLSENRPVSITIGSESTGTVNVSFLRGSMAVALGPLKLAAAAGASILPVVTFREARGVFVTTVEPPLPALAATAGASTPIADLVRTLERHALRHPAQFLWQGGIVVSRAASAASAEARQAPPVSPAVLDTSI